MLSEKESPRIPQAWMQGLNPQGEYRVLYASSQREGAFAETLARYRVDIHVAAELNEIVGDEADSDHPALVRGGVVPRNGSRPG